MARRKSVSSHPEGGGNGKVRVIFVEMEGSDSTIADAIKNVTDVIRQGQIGPAAVTTAVIPPRDEPVDSEDTVVDSSTDEESSGLFDKEPSKPRSSSPRSLPKPKMVEGIDFRAFEPSLEEYVADRQPERQLDKYLVAVGWFCEVAEVEEVGIDHVYSVFKALKWTDLPPDVRQPLVDLQRKKELLAKGSRGYWKLNHLGEAELERMKSPRETE